MTASQRAHWSRSETEFRLSISSGVQAVPSHLPLPEREEPPLGTSAALVPAVPGKWEATAACHT